MLSFSNDVLWIALGGTYKDRFVPLFGDYGEDDEYAYDCNWEEGFHELRQSAHNLPTEVIIKLNELIQHEKSPCGYEIGLVLPEEQVKYLVEPHPFARFVYCPTTSELWMISW